MNLDFKLYSIIMLVGPTNSGKSYFAKNHLVPELEAHNCNVTYLSSDDLRRYYLGDEAHKYDNRMMTVSKKAFDDLHNRINLACQYPRPSQFVVVDTTGLNDEFRKKILQQGKDNGFNVSIVIFDYKKIGEYLLHVNEDSINKRLISKHLERMRTDVYPSLNKKDYSKIHVVKSKKFEDLTITVSDRDLEIDTHCSVFQDDKAITDIIGDIHGCFDEFMLLLKNLRYEIDAEGRLNATPFTSGQRRLVLIGDLIDKGPKSREVVDFVHKNQHLITLVLGNHEKFVNKFLQGEIDGAGMPDGVQAEYFDTSFYTDGVFKEQLQELVLEAHPFFQTDKFIATHAPCNSKFLGKTDSLSLKNQVNIRYPRHEENETEDQYTKKLEEFFTYLKTEGERSFPYHVFGHVPFSHPFMKLNKIGVDTGCVHGGYLTAVTIGDRGRPTFSQVKCFVEGGYKPEKKLIQLFANERTKWASDESNLEPHEIKRINFAIENKVNFISGTMAPAESCIETKEIESLDKCLDYYQRVGVDRVIMQPKYMGSRCNVYLYSDPAKCFAVSRNGFKIRGPEKGGVDMSKIYSTLQEKFKLQDDQLMVLDGELLPWHALGAGLIDETFAPVEAGVRTELDALERLGFQEVYTQSAVTNKEYDQYVADRNGVRDVTPALNREQLRKKYGDAKSHSYSVLYSYKYRNLQDLKKYLAVYQEQLQLFGQAAEPSFKPFAVLKTVNMDIGDTVLATEADLYKNISDDESLMVYTCSTEDRLRAKDFFAKITQDQKMEGVVVKPVNWDARSAPYMKVRSERYLTLVYGYDYLFPDKLERMIATKRTGSKIRTSIAEFQLGLEMLRTPQDQITKENLEYRALLARMIAEEKREKFFDPRL